MTQPATESRLDRLEALAETVLLAIQQQHHQSQATQASLQATQAELQVTQAGLQANQAEMRQSVEEVVHMVGILAESADEDRQLIRGMQTTILGMQSTITGMQTTITGMQTSITGMQTENRRILDHLLNDRSD